MMAALRSAAAAADTASSAAPNPAGTYPIDLPTALQLAGAHNLDIKIAREHLAEARANHQSARWQFYPWIVPGITYRKHDNLTQDVAGNIVNVHKDSYSYGPTLIAQFDLGDAYYKNLAAKQLVKAAEFGLESQRQEWTLAAAQGYFDLAKAQAAVQIAAEAVRIAENYAGQVQRAAEIGTAFKGDALRVEVQADRNRATLRQAREQQQVASVRLRQILRLEPDVLLVARDAELLPLEFIPRDSPAADLVRQAMQARPEINQSRHLLDAARGARDGAKYGPLMPTVGAQVFLGGLGGGRSGIADRSGKSEDYQLTIGWRIGPGGLFDRGKLGAAEARLRTADFTAQKVADEVVRQVTESHARVQSFADQMATTRHAMQTAEAALQLTEQRRTFEVGAVLENIQSEQDLTRARFDYLAAVAEFNKSQYSLARAIGRSSPEGKDEPSASTHQPPSLGSAGIFSPPPRSGWPN